MRYAWLVRTGVLLYCCVFALTAQVRAQSVSPERSLLSAMRLWGDIRYLDPQIPGRLQRVWDTSFMSEEPAIRAATDRKSYLTAINELLFLLHDPATHVDTTSQFRPSWSTKSRGSVSVVTLSNDALTDVGKNINSDIYPIDVKREFYPSIERSSPKGNAILFDLRGLEYTNSFAQDFMVEAFSPDSQLTALVRGDFSLPRTRTRSYLGYPSQNPALTGYSAQFNLTDAQVVHGTSPQDRRIGFLVNGTTSITPAILGLVLAGKASLFTTDRQPAVDAPETVSVELAYGLTATYRTGDIAGISPGDAIATTVQSLDDAVTRMNEPIAPPPQIDRAASQDETSDDTYSSGSNAGMLLPDEGLRMLAVARIYNIIRFFSPYISLAHDDWDAAADRAVSDEAAASNTREYLTGLMRFYAHLHDSHGSMVGAMVSQYYGAGAPISVRYLRHQAIITAIAETTDVPSSMHLGDIIDAIDGVPTRQAMLRAKQLINASTPHAADFASLRNYGAGALFAGPVGSTVVVRYHAPGSAKAMTAKLVRSHGGSIEKNAEPIYTILPGNVGYVDLDRLEPSEVDAMFAALWNTSAIVFDNRGYPRGAAWAIAPRLARQTRTPYALFSTPVVRNPINSPQADITFLPEFRQFIQSLTASDAEKYHKPTVMLIDTRAMSQSEHSALMFRAVAGTRFVGTPTAGVDGDITSMVVPSDILLFFSGQGVQYASGKQLQRVGIQPDRWAEPSASDIAASNDVILQAGLDEALQLNGAPPAARKSAVQHEKVREMVLAREGPGAVDNETLGTRDRPVSIVYTVHGTDFAGHTSTSGGYSGGAVYSMHSVSNVDPATKPFGTYAGRIDVGQYTGRTIRLRGYLATTGVVGGAGFWMRIDAGKTQLDNMQDRWLHGTQGWRPFTIVLHVPDDATKAFGGLLMVGTGEVRASDVQIDVVPDSTPTTEVDP